MIPESFIEKWRQKVPWQTLAMIEQDLVISRALVCLYNEPKIQESLIFRGGTALNKLYINPPARYSEDIDFVQRRPEPIGETIDAIKNALNHWLGEPKRKLTERGVKLIYQYEAINRLPGKLKIEINTTEHIQIMDPSRMVFFVNSDWFVGHSIIETYQLEELMATKIRALYQRRKGRDLFDVWYVFSKGLADVDTTLKIFHHYCQHDGSEISKALFYRNLELKRSNRDFQIDMSILLSNDIQWDFHEAFEFVRDKILSKL